MTKPVIVNVRTAGAQDASDPTDANAADQSTYSNYAANANIINGFDYPFLNTGSGWDGANDFTTSSKPLAYIENHTPTNIPGWFAIQAFEESGAHRMPTTEQMEWLTYRALVTGVEGILFYSYLLSDEDMIADVKTLCTTLDTKDINDILAGTNKDDKATKISGSNIEWAYRLYNDSYYLIVVDNKPETGSSRSYNFECDLEARFDDFAYASNWLDSPSTTITTTTVGSTKKKFSSNESFNVGEYKVYRFLCP
jgi:hypothetical protein